MAGPTDAHDLAVALLQAAADSLDEIPVADPALDGSEALVRVLVTPGLPVDDCCEQLTVHINPVTEAGTRPSGLAAGKRHTLAWLNVVTFTITVGRCIPKPKQTGRKIELPAVADLEAAAAQINADGWALWNGLHNRVASGELFGGCANVTFAPLTARTPSGGCAGWTLDIRVIVNGYQPAES